MSTGLRRVLTVVPLTLALTLAGGLYLVRNPLGRGALEGYLDRYLDTRLSVPVAVRIGAVEGTWWGSFTLRDLALSYEADGRLFFSAREISLGYFLPGLLGEKPFQAIELFKLKRGGMDAPFPSVRPAVDPIEISELTVETVRPDHPLTTALRLYPHEMLLDIDLVFSTSPEGNTGSSAALRLQGTGTDGIRGDISVRSAAEPLAQLGTVRSAFVLTSSEDNLEILPAADAAPDAARLSGRLEADAASGGVQSLEGAVTFRGLAFTFSADAGELSAGLELNEGMRSELLNSFLPAGAGIEPGTGNARLLLRRSSGADYSVAGLLAEDPRRLFTRETVSLGAGLTGWKLGGFRDLRLELDAGFRYPLLSLHRFSAGGSGGLSVEADGEWNLTSGDLRTGTVTFAIPELAGTALNTAPEEGFDPPVAGSVSGTLELSLNTGDTHPLAIVRTLSGWIEVNAEELRLGGAGPASAVLRGEAGEGRLELRRFSLESRDFILAGSGTASLESEVPRVRISQALLISDLLNARRLELRNEAVVSFSEGGVSLSNSILDLAGGEISLQGEYRNGTISLSTAGSDFSPSRFAGIFGITIPVEGDIAWRGRAEGSLSRPHFSLYLESNRMRYGSEPVDLLLSISQSGRGLRLDQFGFSLGNRIDMKGRGEFPFAIGPDGLDYTTPPQSTLLGISISAADLLSWLPVSGLPGELPLLSLNGDFRLENRQKLLSASLSLSGEDSSVAVGGVSGRFERIGLELGLRERPGEPAGLSGSVSLDRNQVFTLDGALEGPDLREKGIPASLEKLGLSGRIMLDIPLGYLAAYLPQLVYSDGTVRGEISLSGPLSGPYLQGSIELSGAEIHPAGSTPAVSGLNGRLSFGHDGVLQVREITGELGRALFTVAGRAALFPGENDAGIDLSLRGSNLLVYSDPDLRIRADTEIDISGSRTAPSISGSVNLSEALYTRDIPLVNMNTPPAVDADALQLFSVKGGTASRTSLNLDIRADRTILIENNIFDGRLSTDLHLGGNLQVPVLTGRVFADDALLSLPLSSVDLNQLLVEFPEESPFRPHLQARGRSQVSGYEIFLQASGAVPTVEIEVSSNPPLPQDQALLLLTTGYADLGGIGAGQRTVRSLGTFFGRQFLEVLFGRSEAERKLLERVDVSVGRQVSSSGSEVIDVEFQLAEDENWYLQFERDRYDQYNLGVAWRLWFN